MSTCQVRSKKVSIDASKSEHSQSYVNLVPNLIYNLLWCIITVPAADEGDCKLSIYPKQYESKSTEGDNFILITGAKDGHSQSCVNLFPQPGAKDGDSQLFQSCDPAQSVIRSPTVAKDPNIGRRDALRDSVNSTMFLEGSQLLPSKPSKELGLDVEDLDIPWSHLVLKERIGAGISLPIFLDKHFGVKSDVYLWKAHVSMVKKVDNGCGGWY